MRDYTNNELRQIVADADRCKRLEQELSNVLADCASQHAADQERIAALVAALEEGHTPPTTFQNCAHPKCKLARATLALAKGE